MAEVAQGDERPRARGYLRRYSERLTFDYLMIDSLQERCTNYVARGGLIEPRGLVAQRAPAVPRRR